ncbi:2,4-dienoyl-CoA reductase [Sporobacter termitidis DSM 10068]|uniref:2,4-dienoyl-CoA reductase n=1 Tax=Sporobacter termitidis DSM 10068 TaxID=1123282 RepID=A0A1M5XUT1_9FIRM|nr:NAD(P)/FAD-dependent oxidoreductase [Sporobacter termitidis]SHI03516.1 2,4-dienoyl-CoA reductase [Sporobacter termitidis DSM 10068]
MYSCKYPNLFSSIFIGNRLFKSRLFASPTGLQYTTSKNRPITEGIAYYERKAIGGAASVCIGDAMIDSDLALANGNHLLLDDPGVRPHLTKLSDAITRHGAVASMELSHGGNAARISYSGGNKIYGPVESDTAGNMGERIHAYEMPLEIMARTIRKFAGAAAFAKRCGFGMVTLHGGHGWLLHQFMSPTQNTRDDAYGGCFENRMRFPLEVIDAVRKAVGPGFPVEIRISGSECSEGGYGIDYGIEIAKALDGKVDLIHVSAGSHEDPRVFTVTHPSMFLEDGVNVGYAAEIKKHVLQSKVATVGALSDPALLEEIIASGKADVVELARGLICDPDLPVKARLGKDGEIVKCMRCFTCFSNLMTNGHVICALNPEISNETEIKFERSVPEKKTVLIAGGGIAGMQAALTAADRGHRVILCEKTDRLGGVLLCEEKVPFKKYLHEYLEHQARMIKRGDIKVYLETAVTPELVKRWEPDALIAALGARPLTLKIPGIEMPHVLYAEELYRRPEKAGKKLVILGGGLVGSELAIFMANRGHDVAIMEMSSKLNDGGNILQGQAIDIELKKLGVGLALSTRAVEINNSGVLAENADGRKLYEADTVVCAVGMKPLLQEAEALRFCAPEFCQIGDCITPKNIAEATRSAYFAATYLGRY